MRLARCLYPNSDDSAPSAGLRTSRRTTPVPPGPHAAAPPDARGEVNVGRERRRLHSGDPIAPHYTTAPGPRHIRPTDRLSVPRTGSAAVCWPAQHALPELSSAAPIPAKTARKRRVCTWGNTGFAFGLALWYSAAFTVVSERHGPRRCGRSLRAAPRLPNSQSSPEHGTTVVRCSVLG
jgi:hypothetical protein